MTYWVSVVGSNVVCGVFPCLWEICWREQLDKTFLQTKQKNGILDLECADKDTRDRWYQQVLQIF